MSEAVLTLPPRLETAGATALRDQVLTFAGRDLELDASEVTHIGALGLQVIRAAAKSWASDGKALTITGLSNDCVDQIQLLGFSPETICDWKDS